MCVVTMVWLKDTNIENTTSVGFVMTCVAFVLAYLQYNPGEIHFGNIVGILSRFQVAVHLVFQKFCGN